MPRRILFALAWMLVLAPFARAEDVTVATFNCEFLTRPKVHIKFGEAFNFNGWTDAGRDAKFAEASQAVAGVIADIDADVIVLTEVGNEADIIELKGHISSAGVDYPHHAVCDSKDTSTGQHVAVLSLRLSRRYSGVHD